ncbi:thioredoxin-dependent thiol peroxidase [Candidatus Peregrinibacteria bacterium HGW-Peregrinibacteria-1]|jgi:peroxiredoxin Q/BCP|nr:MAG: thioredoxin-dependent thiol peroxidase [Candidatus Peregrinibacteria bacterium HGW-Peregrinibacteria-1]
MTKAKEFTLLDQNGKSRNLSDYKGKKVVLYFYPKDMTSGCTIEAQNFNANLGEFKKHNTEIIGVSPDDTSSHQKFCTKENLNFTLLADTEKEVSKQYGVWVEKSMYGKKYMGVERETFLIDEEGNITKHYKKVKPATHVQEILTDLTR